MGPMEESCQNYERQRRRLNARLGLIVFALLPLPAILIALGLSPLKMLLAVASLGMSIGILYPMWWRTKHNPFRASAVETRTRRIAWPTTRQEPFLSQSIRRDLRWPNPFWRERDVTASNLSK